MSTQRTDSAMKASSNHLSRQVGLYSLAAAVAGVSMLALAEPAAAEVVITKKTIPIPMVPYGTEGPVTISMADNGINDFGFTLYNLANSLLSVRGLLVWGVSDNDGVIVAGSFYPRAVPLARGAKIGPSANFFSLSRSQDFIEATRIYSTGGKGIRGYWTDSKDRYLGVRFPIHGETHYGWIRLTVTTNSRLHGPFMSAKVTAYAYETIPNKPILAGTAERPTAEVQAPEKIQRQAEPSLGMLALGADGLPLWRREENSPTN